MAWWRAADLVGADVQPQVSLLVLLHVAQTVRRVVHDEEVRDDRHDLGELQARQRDLHQKLPGK